MNISLPVKSTTCQWCCLTNISKGSSNSSLLSNLTKHEEYKYHNKILWEREREWHCCHCWPPLYTTKEKLLIETACGHQNRPTLPSPLHQLGFKNVSVWCALIGTILQVQCIADRCRFYNDPVSADSMINKAIFSNHKIQQLSDIHCYYHKDWTTPHS